MGGRFNVPCGGPDERKFRERLANNFALRPPWVLLIMARFWPVSVGELRGFYRGLGRQGCVPGT